MHAGAGKRHEGYRLDSYDESMALLEDLKNLQSIDLPTDKFPQPENTQARLALICTATSPR